MKHFSFYVIEFYFNRKQVHGIPLFIHYRLQKVFWKILCPMTNVLIIFIPFPFRCGTLFGSMFLFNSECFLILMKKWVGLLTSFLSGLDWLFMTFHL